MSKGTVGGAQCKRRSQKWQVGCANMLLRETAGGYLRYVSV